MERFAMADLAAPVGAGMALLTLADYYEDEMLALLPLDVNDVAAAVLERAPLAPREREALAARCHTASDSIVRWHEALQTLAEGVLPAELLKDRAYPRDYFRAAFLAVTVCGRAEERERLHALLAAAEAEDAARFARCADAETDEETRGKLTRVLRAIEA